MNVKAYVSDLHSCKLKTSSYLSTESTQLCRNILNCIFSLLSAITSDCNKVPNGQCSHFCFPTPTPGRVCGCPYGMKLQANQRDCIKDDSVVPLPNCTGDTLECDKGRCIPNSYRCDGLYDCLDHTDEANCTDTGEGVRSYEAGNYLRIIFGLTSLLPYFHPHQVLHALRLRSPATTNAASSPVGVVMAGMTVVTVPMRTTAPLNHLLPVLMSPSHVIIAGAFPNSGCVMASMTAAMGPMNTTAVSLPGFDLLR